MDKTEITIDLDILGQLRLAKAGEATGKNQDELIVAAFENFLCAQGYNNLATNKEIVAA